MLRSIQQFYGDKLGASDGEIGHVKDFYFDDRSWAIRYLVVDTGSWLAERQVLLSPHALGRLDQAGKILQVNLTLKAIENSPSIESHKPVSRQYEEEFHRYYGWPYYWQGEALWGISPFPIFELPAMPIPIEQAIVSTHRGEGADAHLLSAKAVNGYQVQGSDGVIGHIIDFMVDAQSWAIRQLVVKTGHRLSGGEVQIESSKVDRVSYEESTVFVHLTKEVIEQSPLHPVDAKGAIG